jgi:hypothetical protein
MAGRGSERFEKRLRERARQEKAAAKRARRADRKDGEDETDEDGAPKPSEDELLEQVRILNEQHAAGDVDDESFEERRLELFEQLGLA